MKTIGVVLTVVLIFLGFLFRTSFGSEYQNGVSQLNPDVEIIRHLGPLKAQRCYDVLLNKSIKGDGDSIIDLAITLINNHSPHNFGALSPPFGALYTGFCYKNQIERGKVKKCEYWSFAWDDQHLKELDELCTGLTWEAIQEKYHSISINPNRSSDFGLDEGEES